MKYNNRNYTNYGNPDDSLYRHVPGTSRDTYGNLENTSRHVTHMFLVILVVSILAFILISYAYALIKGRTFMGQMTVYGHWIGHHLGVKPFKFGGGIDHFGEQSSSTQS